MLQVCTTGNNNALDQPFDVRPHGGQATAWVYLHNPTSTYPGQVGLGIGDGSGGPTSFDLTPEQWVPLTSSSSGHTVEIMFVTSNGGACYDLDYASVVANQ
jgi:hypothetical protein